MHTDAREPRMPSEEAEAFFLQDDVESQPRGGRAGDPAIPAEANNGAQCNLV